METTKNEQKGFIGNSKFGKHFYALVMGLVIVLSGGFYFFVSAQDLNVETSLDNAKQTIQEVIITQDGSSSSSVYFDFNYDGIGGAIFNNVPSGIMAGYLGLDASNKLIYTNALGNDDHDWIIEPAGVYTTGKVAVGDNYYDDGLLSVINNNTGIAELYLGQTNADHGAKVWLSNPARTWSIGADSNPDWFYIGLPGSYPYFSINNIGNVTISGNLDMLAHDITNADLVTAVAFIMSSDKSLKENIKTITNPLDKIYALNGYTFDWKKDGRHDIGLIAQEVEKVLPELVHTNVNGIKGVEYANMVALLIEGVKEVGDKIDGLYNKYLDQQKKIDDLELRINALELKNQ